MILIFQSQVKWVSQVNLVNIVKKVFRHKELHILTLSSPGLKFWYPSYKKPNDRLELRVQFSQVGVLSKRILKHFADRWRYFSNRKQCHLLAHYKLPSLCLHAFANSHFCNLSISVIQEVAVNLKWESHTTFYKLSYKKLHFRLGSSK